MSEEAKGAAPWCESILDPTTVAKIDPCAAWRRLSRGDRALILLRNSIVPLCIYAAQFACLVLVFMFLYAMFGGK